MRPGETGRMLSPKVMGDIRPWCMNSRRRQTVRPYHDGRGQDVGMRRIRSKRNGKSRKNQGSHWSCGDDIGVGTYADIARIDSMGAYGHRSGYVRPMGRDCTAGKNKKHSGEERKSHTISLKRERAVVM